MSDAYISWYRSRTTQGEFMSLVGKFREVGISIEHPNTGSAILLDVDGSQVALPTERVAELVGLAIGALNVEWWLSPDTDLTCYFSYESFGWEKQTYYLGGLTSQEMRMVEKVLFGQVSTSASETVALIVDEIGLTAEFNWDAIVRGDSSKLNVTPQALILDSSISSRLHGYSEEAVWSEFGPNLKLLKTKNWMAPEI